MKSSPDACCIVCQQGFCCADCRWNHEQAEHGLKYNCDICREKKFLCDPNKLNEDFLKHLTEEHLPLYCNKCKKIFTKMDELINIDKCTSLSELVDKENEANNTEVEAKFDSVFEFNKTTDETAIKNVAFTQKTAIITPIIKNKYLVDYDISDSENDETKFVVKSPTPKILPKTPKLRKREATPHAKKFVRLVRQSFVEENNGDEDNIVNETKVKLERDTPATSDENVANLCKEMRTPTSHLPHILKLAQAVTTSTPEHANIGWSIFQGHENDSPLSEIENTESPAQSTDIEFPSKGEAELPRKLKSIISTGNRFRLGSQDSSEKQVTFQDSANNSETSVKIKKVTFAEDTNFESETKLKRVFRKPKRVLTPGPQRPKFCLNPRFQALINRFENQGQTVARTPITNRSKPPETTPPVGEHSNLLARAINFKEESPAIESENNTKESNELFKTCCDSPAGLNSAITAITTNIAGSLQNCITDALNPATQETEIQFKFVITKKTVSVKRIIEDGKVIDEKSNEIGFTNINNGINKENLWSSVAKAVKNIFWSEQKSYFTSNSPTISNDTNSTSSSASKRKSDELSDTESPTNKKRYKYEGRIKGRPPLPRSRLQSSASFLSASRTRSAEHQLLRQMVSGHDTMNSSF